MIKINSKIGKIDFRIDFCCWGWVKYCIVWIEVVIKDKVNIVNLIKLKFKIIFIKLLWEWGGV